MIDLSLILAPFLILCLLSIGCGQCGVLLASRHQNMLPDALAHALLPGVVLAAYWQGLSLSPPVVALGAFGAGGIALGHIRLLESWVGVSRPVALATTYPLMLSLGLVLTSALGLDRTGFDAHSVLFGTLEFLFWPEVGALWRIGSDDFDRAISTAPIGFWFALVGAAGSSFLTLFAYQALKAILFDRQESRRRLGRPTELALEISILCLVLVSAVGAFLAVGAILAVALFAGPVLGARAISRTLGQWLWNTVGIGMGCAALTIALIVLVPEVLLPALGLTQAPIVLGISLSGGFAFISAVVSLLTFCGQSRRA